MIDETKYLFITWDLTKPSDWFREVDCKKSLGKLLNRIGELTQKRELFVHRIIFYSDRILDKAYERDYLKRIWKSYFLKYLINDDGEKNSNYKIEFIEINNLKKHLLNVFKNHSDKYLIDFTDIGIFSNESRISEEAKTKILPYDSEIKK